jgi:hypothetical protein
MFRTVSQTGVNYRGSRLSEGHAGNVQGGELPCVEARSNGIDNYAPLTSLDWQVHVYSEAAQETQAICRERALSLHVWVHRKAFSQFFLFASAATCCNDGSITLAPRPRRGPTAVRRTPTGHHQTCTVTRRNAAGIDVPALLVFCATNSASSSAQGI